MDDDCVRVNHCAQVSLHAHYTPRKPHPRVLPVVFGESVIVFGQLLQQCDDQVQVTDDGKPQCRFEGLNLQEKVRGAVVSPIKCLDVPANGDSCTVGIFLNTSLQTIEHARQAYSSKVDGVTNKTFLNPMLNLWNNTGFSLYRRIYPKGKHEWRCVITRFPRPYNMQLQVTWVFQYIVRLKSPFAVSHTAALNGIFDSLVNHICDPQFSQLYFNLGQRVQSQLLILARLDYLVQTVMRVGRRFRG